MSTGAPNSARPTAHPDGPRLLADVGGTNARFALETAPGDIHDIRVYACADYARIDDAIAQYLKDTHAGHVAHAALAIANPVDGDHIQMTNNAWAFSIEATRRALGFDTLLFFNDFAALAMALPQLPRAELQQVGRGAAQPRAVIGLFGPGTGLGVAGLIPVGDTGWMPLASEGGHVSFAPQDEREDRVLRHARLRWPHVSFERVASGPGLTLIYDALGEKDGVPSPAARASGAAPPDAAEIVRRAHNGEALAIETVDCFCAVLGGFAGNLAVTLGARGGIYIGGGVVPHLGDLFARSPFRARFESKGRFDAYLAQVPTYVITSEYPAFVGVSALLAQALANRPQQPRRDAAPGLGERIRALRPTLPPAQQRVADLALTQPHTFAHDPVAEIARIAGVSQPTVIRFCRALGCDGLSEFKLLLAAGLTAPTDRAGAR